MKTEVKRRGGYEKRLDMDMNKQKNMKMNRLT